MKRIFVIATGGTIAGVAEAGGGQRYRSGALSVASLLDSVPELGSLARIDTCQLANIGSQDMNEALWFELAALVSQKLTSTDCDGVVIIHGTDTLEETAFFLHCVLPRTAKPVVLTGAMRPATAPLPDGPHNLAAAIAVAASDASASRGVLVTFAGQIFAAASVTKIHTQHLDAFGGGTCGALGRISGTQIIYNAPATPQGATPDSCGNGSQPPQTEPAAQQDSTAQPAVSPEDVPPLAAPLPNELQGHTPQPAVSPEDDSAGAFPPLANLSALPKVAVVTAHVGQSPDVIGALVQLGYRGIVYAGLGNGNFSATMLAALKAAHAHGIAIVRASRVPSGGVTADGEVDDAAHGFICAGNLSPQQARILLALALAGGGNLQQVRQCFAHSTHCAQQQKFPA